MSPWRGFDSASAPSTRRRSTGDTSRGPDSGHHPRGAHCQRYGCLVRRDHDRERSLVPGRLGASAEGASWSSAPRIRIKRKACKFRQFRTDDINCGTTTALHWRSVDFNRELLTVEGRNAKNRQTQHVPLNEEAVGVLRRWREQSDSGVNVFGVATGFQSAWEKVLERACIRHFRWHDLRHHFASRLVQQGVPLNTVRDLLVYSSVGMSPRYAHLAPDQRREAVAKLNQRPLLALSMHLHWEHFPHSPDPPTSTL
jgi:hypothetical protein